MGTSNNKMLSALKEHGVDVEETVSRFADNDELYVKFLLRYPDEDKLTPVKEAFEAGDYENLNKTAHKLKGVSINLGMTSLAEKAEIIEKKAKDRTADGLEADIAGVEEEYCAVCRIISENAPAAQTV